MKTLVEMLIAPTEAYDALICTSNAVRHSVDTHLEMMREYLTAEFGPRRRAEPQRVTIPLGVNVDDFATTPEHRKAWRERLDIPEDAVVALFVGRFNVRAKMNPALMALALERAARATGRPIYWVNSGWGPSAELEAEFHDNSRALCPSVHYRHVDGRKPDARFSIWSVADFFISFSDNIQETFGLTPVEAMAAGLPSVVSDWDGYRDTVRHGVDGFRVPTMAPAPGMGGDLAYGYENHWLNYDNYVGAAGQFTSVDLFEAEKMITALVESEDLRRVLGRQAKAQARAVFDWKAVIPQYEALWAEQNARRLATPPDQGSVVNPFRPDPFALFQNYPTRHLTVEHRVVVAPGMDWAQAGPLLAGPLVNYASFNRPTMPEVEQLLEWLGARPGATVRQVEETFPPGRRLFIRRGLLWLARYAVVRILPPS
jgi:glycosyltransferase involved in cell wall biosynthesis